MIMAAQQISLFAPADGVAPVSRCAAGFLNGCLGMATPDLVENGHRPKAWSAL